MASRMTCAFGFLQHGAYEATDEAADYRSAKHEPVAVVMVAAVAVVMFRTVVFRGRRRRVPRDFVSVGGSCRRDVSMPVGWCFHDMLGRHRGVCLALCRSAAFGCSHCRSVESAAKSESHHQFLQCLVVHCRVPFVITRKPILALTQGKEDLAASSDKTLLLGTAP